MGRSLRILKVCEKVGLTCDREVVVQYIEHPRIAKDFANYLELYKKYQARYQIDEILEEAGRAPDGTGGESAV